MKVTDLAQMAGLAQAAMAELALPRWGALGAGDISSKSGPEDLVTVADREIELRLTEQISKLWPDALVWGEEAASADKTLVQRAAEAPLAIALDPIDGTWNYANGLPLFGLILTVTEHGIPVAGVVLDPHRPHAILVAEGALWDWEPGGHCRRGPLPERTGGARLSGYVPMMLLKKEARPALAAEFWAMGRMTSLRCSAHETRMLLMGCVDYIVTGRPNLWDHGPCVAGIIAAGGEARLLSGEPYRMGASGWPLISARNKAVWDEVAEVLARHL